MKQQIFLCSDLAGLLSQFEETTRYAIEQATPGIVAAVSKTAKPEAPTYLTRAQACHRYSLSFPTFHRLVRNKTLTIYKMGRRTLIKTKEADAALVKCNY